MFEYTLKNICDYKLFEAKLPEVPGGRIVADSAIIVVKLKINKYQRLAKHFPINGKANFVRR